MLFLSKSINSAFQLFSLLNSTVFPVSSPSANNFTVTLSGLISSLLSKSSHTFSTGIFILPGVYEFVTVKPLVLSPEIVTSYPSGTGISSIVYTISFPLLFLSKSVNSAFQLFSSFNSTVFPVSSPSANNFIVTLSGLIPSWLLLSFHIFSTGIFIFPGVYVFVIMKPSSLFPAIFALYSLGTGFSSTV